MTKTQQAKNYSPESGSSHSLACSTDSENASCEPNENPFLETEFKLYLHRLYKDLAKRSADLNVIDANTFIAYTGLSGLLGERFFDVTRGNSSTVDLENFTEIMTTTFRQNEQT